MRLSGYVRFPDLEPGVVPQVEFGFLQEGEETGFKDTVYIHVVPVQRWGQRLTPKRHTMLGLVSGSWVSAVPGQQYEEMGYYAGNEHVVLITPPDPHTANEEA